MSSFSPEYLLKSEAIPTLKTSKIIEDFMGDWRKEWFSYNKQKWGIKTQSFITQCGMLQIIQNYILS